MFRFQKLINASQQCCNLLRGTQSIRCLYSENVLGIDGYITNRERMITYFTNNAHKFRSKMVEFIQPESMNMIFTEDLKNMIHIAESTSDDIDLAIAMCKKFHSQCKEAQFGNYVFGPVVMRMLYYHRNPLLALKCFKDPELDGFFDQLVSYQILLDMLYENEQYDDVIDAFELIKTKTTKNPYPRYVVVIVFAACYKQNSLASLEYAKKLWKEHNDIGIVPMRKAATFAAGLTLAQNEPHVTLEILSTVRQINYMTVRNLRILSLARLNRLEDVLPILRAVLETDDNTAKSQTFAEDVIDEVRNTMEKSTNKELQSQFKRINQFLIDNQHVSHVLLDELLCAEISSTSQTTMRMERSMLSASYSDRYRMKDRNTTYKRPYKAVRPGLNQIY